MNAYRNGRVRATGKGADAQFFALPHRVLKHPRFSLLSPYAIKALIDIGMQFNGANNGALRGGWNYMEKEHGWHSKNTYYDARDDLVANGLIIVARPGIKRRGYLFALTWLHVDDCNGKHYLKATSSPLRPWKSPREYPSADKEMIDRICGNI